MGETNQQTLSDILEVVTFIRDNAVTKGEFNELKGEFSEMKKDVTSMKAQMVTKEYLDDKHSDLKGDLTVIVRKEDTKVKALVKKLEQKKVLSAKDAEEILAMEPFPSLAL